MFQIDCIGTRSLKSWWIKLCKYANCASFLWLHYRNIDDPRVLDFLREDLAVWEADQERETKDYDPQVSDFLREDFAVWEYDQEREIKDYDPDQVLDFLREDFAMWENDEEREIKFRKLQNGRRKGRNSTPICLHIGCWDLGIYALILILCGLLWLAGD